MSTLTINSYELIPFNLKTKPLMQHYLEITPIELSDYTFAANYIWLSNASGFYTIINNTFCLFILSSGELSMLLPPLGKLEDTLSATPICFEIMNAQNSSPYYSKIEYVHEAFLEAFVNSLEHGAEIFDSLADYLIEKKLVDYIYMADDLIELKGNSYHSKRNEINKFKKSYANVRTEVFEKEKHGDGILTLFNNWVQERTKYMPKAEVETFLDGIYFERFAIKRLIKDYDKLELIGLVLFIGDEIKGFTMGEKITDDTSSVLIEKTDFETFGCAQFIFREFTKVLKATYNSTYINVGDDMGFENLKKVKMSYRPKKLILKYTIYQK
ncbi:MAG: phosphatidylglycerol lysyltransferase domain-containing protein [Sulfurospirillaceae bacterium]|nr:phosphatidylglycerol lysyltransferase domain-containing protein [Sulfurospirillaceae bacterium]